MKIDSLFRLLYIPENFQKFLTIFNEVYTKLGVYKEQSYWHLIEQYNNTPNYLRLFENSQYMSFAYDALKEFKMDQRRARLVPYSQFESFLVSQKLRLHGLSRYKMEELTLDKMALSNLFSEFQVLFKQLNVMASGSKLVGVSKALHFMLPNLVMPVDGDSVLRFCYGSNYVPPSLDAQFERFKEVFQRYTDLTRHLGLKVSNADGNWWNISVPKRIDNAIAGFWVGLKKGMLRFS